MHTEIRVVSVALMLTSLGLLFQTYNLVELRAHQAYIYDQLASDMAINHILCQVDKSVTETTPAP